MNCSTLDNVAAFFIAPREYPAASRREGFIDITRPINPGMAVYPGNPPVVFTPHAAASEHSSAVTAIALGSHTGTHIDAPARAVLTAGQNA